MYTYRWISLLFLTSKITTFQNEAQIDVLLTGCAGLRIHKTQKKTPPFHRPLARLTVETVPRPGRGNWTVAKVPTKNRDWSYVMSLTDGPRVTNPSSRATEKKYLDLIHLIFFFEVWAQSHVPLQMVSGDDSWSKPEVSPLHHWKDVSSRDLWVIQVNEVSQLDKSFRFFFVKRTMDAVQPATRQDLWLREEYFQKDMLNMYLLEECKTLSSVQFFRGKRRLCPR